MSVSQWDWVVLLAWHCSKFLLYTYMQRNKCFLTPVIVILRPWHLFGISLFDCSHPGLTEVTQNRYSLFQTPSPTHSSLAIHLCVHFLVFPHLPSCLLPISPLVIYPLHTPIFSLSSSWSFLSVGVSFSPEAVMCVRPAAVHTTSAAKHSSGRPALCATAGLNCDFKRGKGVCWHMCICVFVCIWICVCESDCAFM